MDVWYNLKSKLKSKAMKTYIGLDAGHNNLKLVLQDEGQENIEKVIMPSYILLQESLFSKSSLKTPGLVRYLDGTREDLKNKAWLMGAAAIEANEKASVPLAAVADGNGKVEYCLHSLLSLLSNFPPREGWDIILSCSNHRADVYGKVIKKSLEGWHKVSLAGKETLVNVTVADVVDEATHYKPKNSGGDVVLLDFGGGTSIFVKYSAQGINVAREVVDVGVDDLINLIYDDKETYSLLHKDRSRHEIRKGLENSKGDRVFYGLEGRGGIEITPIYIRNLKTWLSAYMKDILSLTSKSLRAGATLQLIGGGSLLPNLEDILTAILTRGGKEAHTINKVTKIALWANSLALLELSKAYKIKNFSKSKISLVSVRVAE
jgi:hypothetical protein